MQRILSKNLRLWLLAAPLALAMTGCLHGDDNNNNNNNGGGGVTPDSTGASVISITPADAALDVARSGNITATFSEAMEPTTITSATFNVIEGTTAVPGQVTYAGNVATFNPTNDLNGTTVVTATITTGVKDLAGNPLTSPKTWSFTTGSVPMVSFTTPDDIATNVAINQNITATFSEAMNAASLTAPTATTFTLTTMEGDTTVPVPGIVTYAGNVAIFNPTTDLAANKKFTAMITTDAKDLSGDALPWNIAWKFTTGAAADMTAPTVGSTVPVMDDIGVATNGSITATFSEPMDAATIMGAFTVTEGTTDAPGANVPGEVTFIGTVATFNPTSVLAANTVLTAKITMAVKDLADNALAADAVWGFTTGAMADTTAPKISFTLPFGYADDAPTNGNITVNFDEAMDVATINSGTFIFMKENGEFVPGKVTYADQVATFNPTEELLPGSAYTGRIFTGAKDLAGNAIVDDATLSWSFTTLGAVNPNPAAVNLGAAGTFAILTKTGVTNSGPSVINGDVGASGIAGTAIHVTCAEVVTGKIYADDAAGPLPCSVANPTLLTMAVSNMETAYTDAAGRAPTSAATTNLGSGILNNVTLTRGVYEWGSAVKIPTDLTFNGSATDVWILKVTGTLSLDAAKNVILSGGAQAKNIFWQVADTVAIGAGAHFEGVVLAKTNIALVTGASVKGRLLAQTAVTLQQNAVTQPTPEM